jgi:uncharacterized protein
MNLTKIAAWSVFAMIYTCTVFVPTANAQIRPSFNCQGNLTINETTICNNSALAILDISVANLYYQNKSRLSGDIIASSQILQSQRDWHKGLKSCEGDVQCLTTAYKQRLEDLSHDPELAQSQENLDGTSSGDPTSESLSDFNENEKLLSNDPPQIVSETPIGKFPDDEVVSDFPKKFDYPIKTKSFFELYFNDISLIDIVIYLSSIILFGLLIVPLIKLGWQFYRIRNFPLIPVSDNKVYLLQVINNIESGRNIIKDHIIKFKKKVSDFDIEDEPDVPHLVVSAYGGVKNIEFLIKNNLKSIIIKDVQEIFNDSISKEIEIFLKSDISLSLQKIRMKQAATKSIVYFILYGSGAIIFPILYVWQKFSEEQRDSILSGIIIAVFSAGSIFLINRYEIKITTFLRFWIPRILDRPVNWEKKHTWIFSSFLVLLVITNFTNPNASMNGDYAAISSCESSLAPHREGAGSQEQQIETILFGSDAGSTATKVDGGFDVKIQRGVPRPSGCPIRLVGACRVKGSNVEITSPLQQEGYISCQ